MGAHPRCGMVIRLTYVLCLCACAVALAGDVYRVRAGPRQVVVGAGYGRRHAGRTAPGGSMHAVRVVAALLQPLRLCDRHRRRRAGPPVSRANTQSSERTSHT
jgi:hypothetical protein